MPRTIRRLLARFGLSTSVPRTSTGLPRMPRERRLPRHDDVGLLTEDDLPRLRAAGM